MGGFPNRGMLLPKTHFLRRVTIPIDVTGDLHIPKMLVTTGLGPEGRAWMNEPYTIGMGE